MSARFYLPFVCFMALFLLGNCKIFKRCELAKELSRNGIPGRDLADWICLVQHESTYNTAATHRNNDNSVDYGLFQLNNRFWCENGRPGKVCNLSCESLLDNNIVNDIRCAKLVKQRQGFSAWAAWNIKCRGKNLEPYVRGC